MPGDERRKTLRKASFERQSLPGWPIERLASGRFAELVLGARRAERHGPVVIADVGSPTGRAGQTVPSALCTFESMVAVDARLLSADSRGKALPACLLEEAFADAPHVSAADRIWVLFEQPGEESKALVNREIGAFDKRRQGGNRVARSDHQAFVWAERAFGPA